MKTFFTVVGFLAVLFSSPRVDAQNILRGYNGYWDGPVTTPWLLMDSWFLNPQELQLRRNEIFARYGRSFETPAIQSHFSVQPWYRPVPNYTDSWIPQMEREWVQILLKLERPTLPENQVRAHMLRNVEYFNTERTIRLTITGDEHGMVSYVENNGYSSYGTHYFDRYQVNYQQDVRWAIRGDWVQAVAGRTSPVRSVADYTDTVYFFRLNHTTKTIVEMYDYTAK